MAASASASFPFIKTFSAIFFSNPAAAGRKIVESLHPRHDEGARTVIFPR
jgi:hypothetical protein